MPRWLSQSELINNAVALVLDPFYYERDGRKDKIRFIFLPYILYIKFLRLNIR